MAYMHKESFDIVVENSFKRPDDYFYIDDLIALPIQILNRKGYITEFCCAGHPFDWLEENGEVVGESAEERAKRLERKIYKSFNSYISFKEGISLPTIPPEFSRDVFTDKECVRKNYGTPFTIVTDTDTGHTLTFADPKIYDNDVYKFMRDAVETMEQLYEWALNLPEFINK